MNCSADTVCFAAGSTARRVAAGRIACPASPFSTPKLADEYVAEVSPRVWTGHWKRRCRELCPRTTPYSEGTATARSAERYRAAPALSGIKDPTATPGYKPVQMPMPKPESVSLRPEFALAAGLPRLLQGPARPPHRRSRDRPREGHRQGEHRQRLEARRATGEKFGVTHLRLRDRGQQDLPRRTKTDTASRDRSPIRVSAGQGSVKRSEELVTNVAAVVTQLLPNGNLVIEGKQEIRVNFEIRELIVAGVIRPEDIEADNTIDSAKIAQARIAYGGRGQITDVQQPRYGQQVMDIVLPF